MAAGLAVSTDRVADLYPIGFDPRQCMTLEQECVGRSLSSARRLYCNEDEQGQQGRRTAAFRLVVFVQGQVEKLAMTAIEFPPMQMGASFNLDAVKAKIAAAQTAMAG